MPLPDLEQMRTRLRRSLREEEALGIDVGDLQERLTAVAGYDQLVEVADALAGLPAPDGEPDDLEAIWAEADPSRRLDPTPVPDAAARVEAALLGSLTGNMLGKPVEIVASLAGLRDHLEPRGEWPIADYLTEASVRSLWVVPPQWPELARERIDHVAPDDDLSYSVLGMLVLERHGPTFTRADLTRLWLENLPVHLTFGPERTYLVAAGLAELDPAVPVADWVRGWNPNKEWCGALIRADAYGYACLGDPALAAQLAWRDAGMTHRRTGIYGTMFVAAAIAAAPLAADPLDLFRIALGYVPHRSRFADAVRFAIDAVGAAGSWLEAYEQINTRYGDFGFCRIHQEIGTMINAVHFARDVGDGVCIQVMQGNDTDSFGASTGSVLGAWFGPGHLEPRWTDPFRDRIHLALAQAWITSISELRERMAALPALVSEADRAAAVGVDLP